MNRDQLERLLRRIADTESDEIVCSECFELLPIAVELELAGAEETTVSSRLARHLGHCSVCREEYEMLRDFVREENRPDQAR